MITHEEDSIQSGRFIGNHWAKRLATAPELVRADRLWAAGFADHLLDTQRPPLLRFVETIRPQLAGAPDAADEFWGEIFPDVPIPSDVYFICGFVEGAAMSWRAGHSEGWPTMPLYVDDENITPNLN